MPCRTQGRSRGWGGVVLWSYDGGRERREMIGDWYNKYLYTFDYTTPPLLVSWWAALFNGRTCQKKIHYPLSSIQVNPVRSSHAEKTIIHKLFANKIVARTVPQASVAHPNALATHLAQNHLHHIFVPREIEFL